jgi:ribosomal protein S27E
MSGTDVLVACQDGELAFIRGTTAMAVIVGTDRLIAPTGGRTRETPEVSDVRH